MIGGRQAVTSPIWGPPPPCKQARKNPTTRRQRERQKTIGFAEAKQQLLHMHYPLLPFLHDYDMKLPTFIYLGERKQATTKFYLFV